MSFGCAAITAYNGLTGLLQAIYFAFDGFIHPCIDGGRPDEGRSGPALRAGRHQPTDLVQLGLDCSSVVATHADHDLLPSGTRF